MKRTFERFMSLLLVLAMVLAMVPAALAANAYSVEPDSTITLTTTYTFTEATWTSSDSTVAKIESSTATTAVIKGVKASTTAIRITATGKVNGRDYSEYFTVYVRDAYTLTLALSNSNINGTVALNQGDTRTLTATVTVGSSGVTAGNLANCEVHFTSDNDAISVTPASAKVTASTVGHYTTYKVEATVKAEKVGGATLTAQVWYQGKDGMKPSTSATAAKTIGFRVSGAATISVTLPTAQQVLSLEAGGTSATLQPKVTGYSGTAQPKLLYLYEGQEKKDGRKELKNVFYLGGLCSGVEANRHLFERMQEYIDTNYESRYLNAVYISGDGGAWIKAGAESIEKGVPVLDKFHMMKYINKAANQMLDEAGEAKGRLWKALYKGKKKKFVKTIKAIRKCAPKEKAVNDCEEYLLNNWDSAVRRMQDKNVYGCSAEGHVSHMYSDRMSSRPMGWSEAGADAMCQLRCYVKDYGEEKILELVKYRRSHKQEEATGTEGISVRPNRGYMRSLLLHHHDNDRVYIEKMQATIPSIDIRKKLAIRERLGGI